MEAVNLKRTPAVTWEYVEILNRFQWGSAFFTHCGKELEHPTSTFGYAVYTKLPATVTARRALSVPLQEFLYRFGALSWIHWNAHYGIAIAEAS